jgi:hypothetical protein
MGLRTRSNFIHPVSVVKSIAIVTARQTTKKNQHSRRRMNHDVNIGEKTYL